MVCLFASRSCADRPKRAETRFSTRSRAESAERIAALQPDVAFLDIQMPGLTGLEVAQGIEGHTRVVFVTAFDEYAVQAFDEEAVDYVLKPVGIELLAQALQQALGLHR